MILNPVTSLFYLYLLANFVAMVGGIIEGGIVLEGLYFELHASSLVFAFILQSLVLVLLLFFYRLFYSKYCRERKISLGWMSGWFLLFIQILFIIFNFTMGVNVAGDNTRIEGGSLINYVFIALQPDILFFLMGILLASNYLFFLNLMVFLISMVFRGWMSGFFIVFFIILVRFYPVRISIRNALLVFCSALVFCLALPAIVDAKWAMRTGVSAAEFFTGVADSFSIEKYSYAFQYLLNRFQHVGHVALLFENSRELYRDFHDGAFISYWMDGLPQYTISKSLGLETYKLNSYMVEYFFGINEPTWNTNPGIAGWLFILKENFIFMIPYFFLVLIAPYYLIRKYAGNPMLMLIACFSITYLFHGWFSAYFNIVSYSLLLILACRMRLYTNSFSIRSSLDKVAT